VNDFILSTITEVAVLYVTMNIVRGIRFVPLPIQDPADVTGTGSDVSPRPRSDGFPTTVGNF